MGSYEPEKHHRRSIRLRGYDYTQPGAYFVTICAQGGECLFGEMVGGELVLSEYGHIVQQSWNDLPNHYPHVELDAWVIMPNHVHGIIVLVPDANVVGADHAIVGAGRGIGAGLRPAPTSPACTGPAPTRGRKLTHHGLPEIVRALKSFSARRINQLRTTPGVPVWQRNYYEHIIRSERALQAIRQYILDNPFRWHLDRYNPAAAGQDPQAKALWQLLRQL